jgi:hypothetical protein
MGKVEDAVQGRVYTNVEYGIYQEYGFSVKRKDGTITNVAPKRYMRGAMDRNKKVISEEAAKWIRSELKRKGTVEFKPFIQKATQLVQRTAKRLAPVDTGRLKGSIKREVKAFRM